MLGNTKRKVHGSYTGFPKACKYERMGWLTRLHQGALIQSLSTQDFRTSRKPTLTHLKACVLLDAHECMRVYARLICVNYVKYFVHSGDLPLDAMNRHYSSVSITLAPPREGMRMG